VHFGSSVRDGIYETESQADGWQIRGTLRGEVMRWNLTKAIRGSGAHGAVGSARVEGRFAEDRIEAVYRDPDSVADRHLQREK